MSNEGLNMFEDHNYINFGEIGTSEEKLHGTYNTAGSILRKFSKACLNFTNGCLI